MRTGKKKLGRMIRITVSWIVVMIILFPIYWILLTSVRPVDEILAYPPKFLPDLTTASTRHYATVLSGKMGSSTNQYGLPTFFLNSVILSVTTTAVTVFISLFTAYGLVRVRFRGRNLASHLILLCYLVPGIALMIPMFTIAVQLRLNNTLAGVILFQIAMNLPLGIWFAKAFIQGIPESLEEASRLDGCNRIQVIQKIILPLAVPGLVVVGFNTFLSSWNDYLLPSILCLDVTDDTKIIPCTTAFSTLHSLFILFTHSTRCTKYSSQSVGNADKSRNNTCPAFVSFKWIINEVLYVIFHPLWPQQSPAGTPAQIRHTWYR